MPVKNLLFDFGNVIINIDESKSHAAFHQVLGSSYDVVMKRFSVTKLLKRANTQTVTLKMMCDEIETLGVKYQPEQIKSAWNALILDLPEERINLLAKLRRHYNLYMLSNINLLHDEEIERRFQEKYGSNPLRPLFQKMYYSYKIGIAKPDLRAYEKVIQDAGILPEETLFFDDLLENLHAAAQLGFRTQRVTRQEHIVKLCKPLFATFKR